jgi:hypothetical protein
MFRSTHTAKAVSVDAPVFRRRSPISRYSDSRGNLICPAISFAVLPDANPRSKITSSAVNRGANGANGAVAVAAGFAPAPVAASAVAAALATSPVESILAGAPIPTPTGGRGAFATTASAGAVRATPPTPACLNSTDFICPRVAMISSVLSQEMA